MFDLEAKRKRLEGEEGFTLIELLVVIIILGILAAVVVFAVGGVGDKGQQSACVIDTRTIRTAQEAFSAQPTTATPPGGGGNYANSTAALVAGQFLSETSTLHNTQQVAGNPKAYTITVLSSPACGTPNAVVGTTTTTTNPDGTTTMTKNY